MYLLGLGHLRPPPHEFHFTRTGLRLRVSDNDERVAENYSERIDSAYSRAMTNVPLFLGVYAAYKGSSARSSAHGSSTDPEERVDSIIHHTTSQLITQLPPNIQHVQTRCYSTYSDMAVLTSTRITLLD